MLLWHEKGVEVPEAGFDEFVGWHLFKSHLEENLSELMSDLVQRVKRTGMLISAQSLEVIWLESRGLPCAGGEHVGCEIGLLLNHLKAEFWSLGDLEGDDLLHLDELTLLEVGEDLGVWVGLCVVDGLELLLGLILDVLGLQILA